MSLIAYLLSLAIVGCEPGVVTEEKDAGSIDAGMDAAVDASVDLCSNGLPDEGEVGIDCGGACPGCAPGAPCVSDSDCADNACLTALGGYKTCFGPSLDGCIELARVVGVTCGFRLFVCGRQWPIADLGRCQNVGVGPHGEVYHCCKV